MPPKEVYTINELRNLARKHSITTLYFLVEKNQERVPPLSIRLYFYHDADIYFLIDYAHIDKLTLIGIPIRFYGSKKEPYISEEDVKTFIDKEFKGINVSFDFEI